MKFCGLLQCQLCGSDALQAPVLDDDQVGICLYGSFAGRLRRAAQRVQSSTHIGVFGLGQVVGIHSFSPHCKSVGSSPTLSNSAQAFAAPL